MLENFASAKGQEFSPCTHLWVSSSAVSGTAADDSEESNFASDSCVFCERSWRICAAGIRTGAADTIPPKACGTAGRVVTFLRVTIFTTAGLLSVGRAASALSPQGPPQLHSLGPALLALVETIHLAQRSVSRSEAKLEWRLTTPAEHSHFFLVGLSFALRLRSYSCHSPTILINSIQQIYLANAELLSHSAGHAYHLRDLLIRRWVFVREWFEGVGMPSSRVKILTGKAIDRRILGGRGQGEAATYQPWLYVTDVPSRGTTTVITGWIHGREHHFLSQGGRVLDEASIPSRPLRPYSEPLHIANRGIIAVPVVTLSRARPAGT
jgi:hypothetical protein